MLREGDIFDEKEMLQVEIKDLELGQPGRSGLPLFKHVWAWLYAADGSYT